MPNPAHMSPLAAARYRERFADDATYKAHFRDLALRSAEVRKAKAASRARAAEIPPLPPMVVLIVGREVPLGTTLADIFLAAAMDARTADNFLAANMDAATA